MTRIISNPKIFMGKPIIRGTRISVEFVLELLGSGMTPQEIIREYPQLKIEDIFACINYAAMVVKREELIPV